MKRHSEKGSALLIVLGFLSFMVVSAVAFAVWMRTERIPSSVLRRNVANRYLVKAALAQAMSQVDDAIRSHVYPGAWFTNGTHYGTSNVKVYRDGSEKAYDWWESRVFMPPDSESNSGSRYAPISKTVSVLNLEALGYLPPAIVNDVRFLHRASWAAKWDYFNFDAGRYAFCAVNVSDMLDVNKAAANAPRSSAAAAHSKQSGEKPQPSRFSYASLFRNGDDNFSAVNGRAETFDKSVHENREDWADAPMVSLMDYNLSVGPKMDRGSPFYELASGQNESAMFYESKNPKDPFVKNAERQPFVTDSWYPKSAVDSLGDNTLDISQDQPFEMSDLQNGDSVRLLEVFNKNINRLFWDSRNGNDKKLGLCFLDMFTLHDYLDEDSVPLSLGMPCVERVPMLAAVEPLLKLDFSFTPGESPNPKIQGKVAEVETPMLIEIKVDAGRSFLNSLFVFPFKEGQTPPDGCTAEAFARVVFVCEPKVDVQTSSALPLKLRNNALAKFKPLTKDEWSGTVQNQFQLDSGNGGGLQRPAVPDCLLLTLPSNGEVPIGTLSPNDEKGVERELKFKDGTFKSTTPIITTISEHSVSTVNGAQEVGPPKGTPPKYRIGLRPFDVNTGDLFNKVDLTKDMSQEEFDSFCGAYNIRPYLLVWARIKDKDGKTIDLVPATAQDDQILNDINNSDAVVNPRLTEVASTLSLGMSDGNSEERKLPVLRFGCADTFSYASAVATSGGAGGGGGTPNPQSMVSWMPRAFFTVDPRFNWAPEDWYAVNDSDKIEDLWYKNLFENGILKDHKDKAQDPFLFVSNQGYLQSVGELCFLPRLSPVDESRDAEYNVVGCQNVGGTKYKLYDGVERSKDTVNTMPSWRAAWTSYQNIRTNPEVLEFGANMYRRGAVNGSQGLYVNPFTQSHETMLAALANTPLNYWVASTNTVFKSEVRHPDWGGKFDNFQKWTFGEGGKGAQINGVDIHKIATFLQHRFEDLASMVEITDYNEQTLYALQNLWTDMFDALDWNGSLGLTVKDVYDDLKDYYNSSAGAGRNEVSYSKTYSGDSHGYQALNRLSKGTNMDGIIAGIRLHPDRAIHKTGVSADPLVGDDGSSTTTCRDEFDHVDRMFLHSYWRDCFANRQQLFLIFVRAEATALGAAGEGTPPQQGGRAVALVWRDPLPVIEDSAHNRDDLDEDEKKATYTNSGRNSGLKRCPHRMRILFYRQFD